MFFFTFSGEGGLGRPTDLSPIDATVLFTPIVWLCSFDSDILWLFISYLCGVHRPCFIFFYRHLTGNSFGVVVTALVTSTKHIKLRRARLVLGLMTTFDGSTIPVISRSLRPTQPGHPSVVRCNECRRWFRQSLGKKRRVLRSISPANVTAGILGEVG